MENHRTVGQQVGGLERNFVTPSTCLNACHGLVEQLSSRFKLVKSNLLKLEFDCAAILRTWSVFGNFRIHFSSAYFVEDRTALLQSKGKQVRKAGKPERKGATSAKSPEQTLVKCLNHTLHLLTAFRLAELIVEVNRGQRP